MKTKCLIIFMAVCVFLGRTACGAEIQAGDLLDKATEVMRRADDTRDNGNASDAVKLYEEALRLHMDFAKEYPSWQPKMLKYRINYCNNQINALFLSIDAVEPEKETGVGATELETVQTNETVAPAPASVPDPTVRIVVVERALAMLSAGEGGDARTFLLDALKADPDSKSFRFLVGVALCQEGKYEDAFYVLTQLVSDCPDYTGAYVALAAAKAGMGRMEDAVSDLKTAMEKEPRMAEAHFNLAQALRLSSPPDVKGSLDHYEQSLKLGGRVDEDLEALALQ